MEVTMIHDDFSARPKHQVKSIAKDDVGTGGANLLWVQTLYTAIGAYRHEGRSSDFAAWELHSTGAGFTVGCADLELHVAIGHRV
jgi:hypothetical protein